MNFSIDDGDTHVIALPDEGLGPGGAPHTCENCVFVGRGVINFVPFDRAHVSATQQVNLAVQHDSRHRATWTRQPRDWCPLVRRSVVDKALRMRAAVLLDEATKRVDLGPD